MLTVKDKSKFTNAQGVNILYLQLYNLNNKNTININDSTAFLLKNSIFSYLQGDTVKNWCLTI